MAVALAASAAALAPAAAATPAAPPLDELASTIGALKASLSTIREEMEAMRSAGEPMSPPALCGAALPASEAALEQHAAWRHAEAAMTGELINTRERLAAAEAAAAVLRSDRERLVERITELDRMVQKARTSALVDDLVDKQRVSIEPLEANGSGKPRSDTELSAASAPELLRVARPALAEEALPALRPVGGRDLARAASRLDLQAELALAQLRIAELNTALEAARMREEAMAAEVTTLRSLTGDEIERFMMRDD